jgi:hypothetical protein
MNPCRVMRTARAVVLILALLVPVGLIGYVMACGVERWAVKTGTDADSWQVDLDFNNAWGVQVGDLASLSRPGYIPANNRADWVEVTVFQMYATLVKFKRESDSDYHLVLMDDYGNTMVGEIPAPNCVGNSSPFKDYITYARYEFDSVFNATTSFQNAYVPVLVTGVGFWDYNHGQTGHAPNFVELHPILDIQFWP